MGKWVREVGWRLFGAILIIVVVECCVRNHGRK